MTYVIRASTFVNSVGVDTHLPYGDSLYTNLSLVESAMSYLGLTNIRDGVTNGPGGFGQAPLSTYETLAAAGYKFTFVINDSESGSSDPTEDTTTAALAANVALMAQVNAAVPGSVVAVEGPDEIDQQPGFVYNGLSGQAGAQAEQADLYSLVKNNGNLGAGVAVDFFTGYTSSAVNPSTTAGYADYDNQHPYPQNGSQPLHWLDTSTSGPNGLVNESTPGPFVFTEAGYTSNLSNTNGVNQSVQARETLNMVLDALQLGASKIYLYQLLDGYAAGTSGYDGFGLFNDSTTLSPKPVATALHNFFAITADSGSNANTFATSFFAPVLSGLASTTHYMVSEKSSGVFDLILWNEAEIWNPTTQTQSTAPTTTVTVNLGAAYNFSEYDPLSSASAVASVTGVQSFTIGLTDHPVIIELAANASANAASEQYFINASYQSVLGRAADAGGASNFTAFLNGGARPVDLRYALITSGEGANDINAAYVSVLNRSADTGGAAGAVVNITYGEDLSAFRNGLIYSAEGQNDITNLFLTVLGRAPDSSGLSGYSAFEATGAGYFDVRYSLAYSSEGRSSVASLLATDYGRAATSAEVTSGQLQLTSGLTRTDLNTLSMHLASSPRFISGAGGTETGTAGVDGFSFIGAFGNNTIQSFDVTKDFIQISTSQFPNIEAVKAHESASGAGTLFQLDANHSILLANVAPSSLTAANFQFV